MSEWEVPINMHCYQKRKCRNEPLMSLVKQLLLRIPRKRRDPPADAGLISPLHKLGLSILVQPGLNSDCKIQIITLDSIFQALLSPESCFFMARNETNLEMSHACCHSGSFGVIFLRWGTSERISFRGGSWLKSPLKTLERKICGMLRWRKGSHVFKPVNKGKYLSRTYHVPPPEQPE